tara:strand:+ start:172 stop:786 length:615 start_codon:yes stop_codon:yes gene_type:complete
MIDKLKELKQRTESLSYNNKKVLDDIQRKTKLYLEKAFPNKFTYSGEVDRISFFPSFYVSGMGSEPYTKSWKSGQEELINLLDTRIEELQLENQKPKNTQAPPRVIEKVVHVEDYKRISELTQELNAVKAKKTLWERINYFALGGIILTLVGSSFVFGKFFGENRFDKEKIQLLYDNNDLKERNDSLNLHIKQLEKQISEKENN